MRNLHNSEEWKETPAGNPEIQISPITYDMASGLYDYLLPVELFNLQCVDIDIFQRPSLIFPK
jgi:hypothetical protein